MVSHFSEWWAYGAFFLVVMSGQLLWAAWLYRHPDDRRTLVYGAIAGLAIAGVWVVTRTVGLPVGPDAGRPEQVGGIDLMASLDQLMIAALVATIVAPTSAVGRRLARVASTQSVRLASMFCTASFFAVFLASHHS